MNTAEWQNGPISRPDASGVKQLHIVLIESVGQVLGKGSAGQFPLGVRGYRSAGATVIYRLTGLEDPHPTWCPHMAGSAGLDAGWGPWSF